MPVWGAAPSWAILSQYKERNGMQARDRAHTIATAAVALLALFVVALLAASAAM